MALWRCPHCGTPQAEASRCWVCRRSSTTCSTCRHFRRSLDPHVGYCGFDRRRLPLTGFEMRGCWSAGGERDAEVQAGRAGAAPAPIAGQRSLHREFVPVATLRSSAEAESVGEVRAAADRARRADAVPPASGLERPEAWVERVSLFGDEG